MSEVEKICPYCDKIFVESKIREHLNMMHLGLTKKPYECDLCEKSFTQRGSLGVHKKSAHEKLTFKCDVCEKEFKTKPQLKVHKGNVKLFILGYRCNFSLHPDLDKVRK